MTPHIQAAVDELDTRIADLTQLRNQLVQLFPAPTAPPVDDTRKPGCVQRFKKRRGGGRKSKTPKCKRPARGPYKKRKRADEPLSAPAPVRTVGARATHPETVKETEASATPVGNLGPATTASGARISTLGGAMKVEIARFTKPFTLEDLKTRVAANHGGEDFYRNASENALYQNLFYWASKGFLVKLGTGPLATYRVVEKQFFTQVEA